jgi:hypothetical protein
MSIFDVFGHAAQLLGVLIVLVAIVAAISHAARKDDDD